MDPMEQHKLLKQLGVVPKRTKNSTGHHGQVCELVWAIQRATGFVCDCAYGKIGVIDVQKPLLHLLFNMFTLSASEGNRCDGRSRCTFFSDSTVQPPQPSLVCGQPITMRAAGTTPSTTIVIGGIASPHWTATQGSFYGSRFRSQRHSSSPHRGLVRIVRQAAAAFAVRADRIHEACTYARPAGMAWSLQI